MSFVRIAEEVAQAMIKDAERSYPYEGCGFLYGKDNGDDREIAEFKPVVNAQQGDKRRRFHISAQDYIRAEQYALGQGLDLVGIYHSHPDHPAIASETDRQAAQPFFSYIIVSVMKGKYADLRSWQLQENGLFEEEETLVEEDHVSVTVINTRSNN